MPNLELVWAIVPELASTYGVKITGHLSCHPGYISGLAKAYGPNRGLPIVMDSTEPKMEDITCSNVPSLHIGNMYMGWRPVPIARLTSYLSAVVDSYS